MNVLANKRLDLDIINIISDLSTELQIKAFLVGGYVRDLILDRKSKDIDCLLYTSPSPRDLSSSRMPSSA